MGSTVTSGTRALAVFLIAVMAVSAIPNIGSDETLIEEAAAAGEDVVKVGWMQEFQNWNPLKVEMVSDWVACYLIYSSLFQYDEDWDKIEMHLATDYYQVIWPAGNMSTFINITENAYFRNAENPEDTSHPLTAFDVEYTIELIQANPGGQWDYYVLNITGVNATDDGQPWDDSRTDNPYQVRIDTEFTKATLIDDLLWIPILPKYVWSTASGKVLSSMSPDELIGSGPFYFAGMDLGQWVEFTTAPNYHAETDYGQERDIDIDGILYVIYTETTELAVAINGGEVDVVDITGAQLAVWESVGEGSSTVTKQVTNELGIYDIAINAIPEEFESSTYLTNRNKILLDPVVREAIGMTLNRQELVDSFFFGLPEPADTVLNPGYWHADLPNPLPYDPTGAKDLLIAAGYEDTNSNGILEVTSDTLPYTMGWAEVGDELEFRLHVPDSDPGYATVGSAWVAWAELGGIRFDYEQLSEGIMVSQEWYKCNYDLWVWSWYWGPEPLSNLMCWKSEQIREGGYNCQLPVDGDAYSENWTWADEDAKVAHSYFDTVFDEAMRTVDKEDRKVLVDQLQIMIYDEYVEFPPLYPNGLYAWVEDRFVGWGNWEDHVARSIISDMLWLWYDLEPVGGNRAPVFDTPPSPYYEVEVNEEVTFTIGISDEEGDPITVNWSFGDGAIHRQTYDGDTTVEQTITQTHTYTVAQNDLTLRVGLSDGLHTFETVVTSEVDVLTEINDPPTIDSIIPPTGVYVDEEASWSVTASDHEQGEDGEGLLFTWNWGDGTHTTTSYKPVEDDELVTDTQTHAWSVDGTYYVTISVWDGFDTEENEQHNVSVTMTFKVWTNIAPLEPIVGEITGLADTAIPCVAVSSDADPDLLTFTWEWDDGTYSVTTVDTSSRPGSGVRSVAEHTWDAPGTYPVTVYVDDGIEEHNVSTTVDAVILASGQVQPSSITVAQSPRPCAVDEEVTLNVSAYDANGDSLTMTLQFGDGEEEVTLVEGDTTVLQYVEFAHVYSATGVYDANISVYDGTTNVTVEFEVLIVENEPPTLSLQSSYTFYYNVSKEIKPVLVSDPDGDMLTIWYDWGDDTPVTMGDPDSGHAAEHTYASTGEFTLNVSADDGKGHNISETASVSVQDANRKPKVQSIAKSLPVNEVYRPGDEIQFTVTIYDTEGDNVTVRATFGDGSDSVSVEIMDLLPKENRTVVFNHTYDDGRSLPYSVLFEVMDDQPHENMTWNSQQTTVTIVEEKSDLSGMVLAGLAILLMVIAAIVALMMLKRRKEGGLSSSERAGMEGMAPTEIEEEAPAPKETEQAPEPPKEQ
jgi:ABC-type transport system substrate-binding protein